MILNPVIVEKIKKEFELVGSYQELSEKVGVTRITITKYCKFLNIVIKPNRRYAKKTEYSFSISDILNGLHPQYPTSKLKIRLIREGYKQNECEICKLSGEWKGLPLSLQLDHIDGDSTNHFLSNLRILCPNCHSQTDTFGSKNLINKRINPKRN